MNAPTIASLRAKVLRAMRRGPIGPDIGAMSHAERESYLAASAIEARRVTTPKSGVMRSTKARSAKPRRPTPIPLTPQKDYLMSNILREKIADIVRAVICKGGMYLPGPDEAADEILDLPEIRELLHHQQIATEFRHHDSASSRPGG